MALAIDAGVLKEEVAAKTRQYLGRNNILLGLMDNSDQSKFTGGVEAIKLQRRRYSKAGGTDAPEVTKGARNTSEKNREWAVTGNVRGTSIEVALRETYEQGFDIPRLDYHSVSAERDRECSQGCGSEHQRPDRD